MSPLCLLFNLRLLTIAQACLQLHSAHLQPCTFSLCQLIKSILLSFAIIFSAISYQSSAYTHIFFVINSSASSSQLHRPHIFFALDFSAISSSLSAHIHILLYWLSAFQLRSISCIDHIYLAFFDSSSSFITLYSLYRAILHTRHIHTYIRLIR